MARVRWHGHTFTATPLEPLADGDWKMCAQEHGARFTTGTEIIVRKNEILSMDGGYIPDPKASAAALEAAMAAERDTLPSVASLLQGKP